MIRQKPSINFNPGITIDRIIVERTITMPMSYWDREPPQPNPRNQILMPSLRHFEKIADDERWRIPDTVLQGPKQWKKLPDTMTPVGQWIVSEKFHDIVKKHDPDGHQFFPVEIIGKQSGKPYSDQGQFYFWNILNFVPPWEIYDIEAMRANGHVEHKEKILQNGCLYISEIIDSSHPYLILRNSCFEKNPIGGTGFRRMLDSSDKVIIYSSSFFIFFESVVVQEMKKKKVTSVDFIEVKSV